MSQPIITHESKTFINTYVIQTTKKRHIPRILKPLECDAFLHNPIDQQIAYIITSSSNSAQNNFFSSNKQT